MASEGIHEIAVTLDSYRTRATSLYLRVVGLRSASLAVGGLLRGWPQRLG
jgi:hypothetical protein